jgi:hypothetical protein
MGVSQEPTKYWTEGAKSKVITPDDEKIATQLRQDSHACFMPNGSVLYGKDAIAERKRRRQHAKNA